MKSDNKSSEKKTGPEQKKLGIQRRVRTEARIRSGCSKSITRTCGVTYRGG